MPELTSSGAERDTFVKPSHFSKEVENSTLTLSFRLKQGNYATVLLMCLFGEVI